MSINKKYWAATTTTAKIMLRTSLWRYCWPLCRMLGTMAYAATGNEQRVLFPTLMSSETGSFYCHCCFTFRIDSPPFLLIYITRSLIKVQGRRIWFIKPRSYTLAAKEAGRGVSCLFSFYIGGGSCLLPRFLRRDICSYRKGIWICGSQKQNITNKKISNKQCPPHTPVSYILHHESRVSRNIFFFSFYFYIDIECPPKSKHLQLQLKRSENCLVFHGWDFLKS